ANNYVSFEIPDTICRGHVTTFTNTSSNINGWNSTWVFGQGGRTNTVNGSFTFPTTGTFPVFLVMDSAGCDFAAPLTYVTVGNTCASGTVGIENIQFDNSVTMMPNPSNGHVSLIINGADKNV